MGFGHKTDLRRHINSVHEGNKPFRCKGTVLSEDADVFVITPNRRTVFFPETENCLEI